MKPNEIKVFCSSDICKDNNLSTNFLKIKLPMSSRRRCWWSVLLLCLTVGFFIYTNSEANTAEVVLDSVVYWDGTHLVRVSIVIDMPDDYRPPMLVQGPLYLVTEKIGPLYKQSVDNGLVSNVSSLFSLDFDGVLSVNSQDNSIADIFELSSGKNVVSNLPVTKENKTKIDGIQHNVHYLITLKSENRIQQKTFFINNNNLFVGGQNEK